MKYIVSMMISNSSTVVENNKGYFMNINLKLKTQYVGNVYVWNNVETYMIGINGTSFHKTLSKQSTTKKQLIAEIELMTNEYKELNR